MQSSNAQHKQCKDPRGGMLTSGDDEDFDERIQISERRAIPPIVRHKKVIPHVLARSHHTSSSESEDEDEDEEGYQGYGWRSTLRGGPGGGERKTRKKQKKTGRGEQVTANLTLTRYEVVYDAAENEGFTINTHDDPNCFLIWSDSPIALERISDLKPYQRANHFPGMGELCRKDCLARNMAKMAKVFPLEYNYVPKTWILPTEYLAFQMYAADTKGRRGKRSFIIKPVNGSMGQGIEIVRHADKVPPSLQCIVQEYIDNPFLVDGYKCDLRLYVLMTSCDPLRLYLYNDGLLRMSTEKYESPDDKNLDHLYMHLTNYSINKRSENFLIDDTGLAGSKRSLQFFNDYLREAGHDVNSLWQDITEVILKTMIVGLPHVYKAYRLCRPIDGPAADSVCFEILGFDIILDDELRPWLLEINRSPSFGVGQQLDYDIKLSLLQDSLHLLNIRLSNKRKNEDRDKEQTRRRLLRPAKRGTELYGHKAEARRSLDRRKEELTCMLERIRREEKWDMYECQNLGRYRKIFPAIEPTARERYVCLLTEAFKVLSHGHTRPGGMVNNLPAEINKQYRSELKYYEVEDMLAQCEADEELIDATPVIVQQQRATNQLRLQPGAATTVNTLNIYNVAELIYGGALLLR